jgi:3-hydroxyisobutyrate dehydrogenase
MAVIGLGSMGFGMAASLARKGFDVAGTDINAEAVQRFASYGRAEKTPAAAAKGAAVLVTVVVNAAQTRAVLFGQDGAADALQPEAVIISAATMSPKDAKAIAAEAEARKLIYLDAPISGGAQRATEGALTILASGSDAAFAKAQPALDAMAAKLYRLGDEPGIGSAFKMVNQLLAGVHIAAGCEAITFAKHLGLDIAKVYEVITAAAGNSWMFENRMPHVLEGDYTPRSAVDIFTKDLGIVLDMSRDTRFPTPIAGQAFHLFMMTAAAGMGRDDDASVARLYAQIAGVDLPSQK